MKRILLTIICLLSAVSVNVHAQDYQLSKTLENFCSVGLAEASFTCGNPDIGFFNGKTDLNNNGIYDIYEVGRTFTIDQALPTPPQGYKYEASSDARIRIEAFGDLDSYPDTPANPEEISAEEHYDVDWMDVALNGYALGRIFDGNLDNDIFDMGVEQGWWGNAYDRGTLWSKAGPEVVYGTGVITRL